MATPERKVLLGGAREPGGRRWRRCGARLRAGRRAYVRGRVPIRWLRKGVFTSEAEMVIMEAVVRSLRGW